MKKIIVCLCLIFNNFAVTMDQCESCGSIQKPLEVFVRQDERKDVLSYQLVYSIIDEKFNEKSLPHISLFLKQGADPNFSFPTFGMTPLMGATCNNNPECVKLLLKNNANVHARNTQGLYVRNFNLIYNEEKLRQIIWRIADLMLKIETHNRISKEEPIDCQRELYALPESEELRKALYIDKIFEDLKAESSIKDCSHPLIQMLKKRIILKSYKTRC